MTDEAKVMEEAYEAPPRERLICKRCGGHMQVQVVNKVGSKSSTGAFGWLFWGALAIPTCGLALLVPLLRSGKTTSHMEKYATCAACGHSERRF